MQSGQDVEKNLRLYKANFHPKSSRWPPVVSPSTEWRRRRVILNKLLRFFGINCDMREA